MGIDPFHCFLFYHNNKKPILSHSPRTPSLDATTTTTTKNIYRRNNNSSSFCSDDGNSNNSSNVDTIRNNNNNNKPTSVSTPTRRRTPPPPSGSPTATSGKRRKKRARWTLPLSYEGFQRRYELRYKMRPPLRNSNSNSNSNSGSCGSAKKKKGGTTILDKIVSAIRGLKDPGPKGSSRTAITKYLKSECDCDNATAIKKAFKKGVDDGVLVQTGQSFRVSGDPVVEPGVDAGEQLVIEDLDSSSAAAEEDDDDDSRIAQPGDVVTVAYRGTLDDGHQFDKASRFEFVLGVGEVIKGWDRGIANMRVGGKRRLTVPSKLGYGKRGCKPDIPPNATLNFVVTLKGIKRRG
eukprot:jgi/Psemu1/10660/gm1.10660_g